MALAFNAALSALNAVIPDQVPSSRLGFHSSVVGFTPPVGVLLGVWIVRQLAPDIAAITLAQAGLVCALTIGFVCFARDRRLDAATVRPLDWRALAASFWTDPRRYPDFGVAWLSRALVLFGVTSLQTWLLFYLRDRMGLSTHAATRAMFVCLAVATAAMTLSAIVFGYLSDRLRRRKVFVIVAGCGLAFGLPAILLCTTMEALLGVVAWLGAAQGAYLAVDLALMTEVLPDRGAAAKDMGVFQITNVIPQLILPLCTPWLTAAGGVIRYDTLFVAVGGATLLGAVAIGFVRSVR